MLLNINKPAGITSHDVVDRVRKITGERTVGHAGTLDPFATGVLVVGVGRSSTRQLGHISKETEKEYVAQIVLGQTSSTGDPEGDFQVSCEPAKLAAITATALAQAAVACAGTIQQRPPNYSAIKIKGVPAYKLARQKKVFELPLRTVQIIAFDIIAVERETVTARIACSSGTYIRTLAEDFGKQLGTGAYVSQLTRTRVGHFRLEESKTLAEL